MNFTVQARIYHEEHPRVVQVTFQVPEGTLFEPADLEHLIQNRDIIEHVLQHSFDEEPAEQPRIQKSDLNNIAPRKRYTKKLGITEPCSICQDVMKAPKYIRTLPCQHSFCSTCIEKWVTKHSANCPICRLSLLDTTS